LRGLEFDCNDNANAGAKKTYSCPLPPLAAVFASSEAREEEEHSAPS